MDAEQWIIVEKASDVGQRQSQLEAQYTLLQSRVSNLSIFEFSLFCFFSSFVCFYLYFFLRDFINNSTFSSFDASVILLGFMALIYIYLSYFKRLINYRESENKISNLSNKPLCTKPLPLILSIRKMRKLYSLVFLFNVSVLVIFLLITN
jgi:hypothetical protein